MYIIQIYKQIQLKNSVHLSVLTVLLWKKKRKEREKKEASWKVLKETTSDFQAT